MHSKLLALPALSDPNGLSCRLSSPAFEETLAAERVSMEVCDLLMMLHEFFSFPLYCNFYPASFSSCQAPVLLQLRHWGHTSKQHTRDRGNGVLRVLKQRTETKKLGLDPTFAQELISWRSSGQGLNPRGWALRTQPSVSSCLHCSVIYAFLFYMIISILSFC